MEIAPGVHQLSAGRASNVFLVMEPAPTLIDSGTPRKGKMIADALAEIGLALGDVQRLILTHWHLDHIGSAEELRRVNDMEVYLHPLDAPYALREKPARALGARLATRLMGGRMRYGPPRNTLPLAHGQRIGDLEVIHTPGHTPGHVSLLQGGVLFAADALMTAEKFRVPPFFLNEDTAQARASLKTLLQYQFHTAVSGHGRKVDDARTKLAALVNSQ